MNLKDVLGAVKDLAENLRKSVDQKDGSVYAADSMGMGRIKFSIVEGGRVKIFTIHIYEESL